MRQILVKDCGTCPYFNEGEVSDSTGERWTIDSCLKGYGVIFNKDRILITCELERAFFELM